MVFKKKNVHLQKKSKMNIDIVDLNLEKWHDWWDKNKESYQNVYIYTFPELYMNKHDSDVYIFLWDDGKLKAESYEVRLIMPSYDFGLFNYTSEIDRTFYGEDKESAYKQMLEWSNKMTEVITELNEKLCKEL